MAGLPIAMVMMSAAAAQAVQNEIESPPVEIGVTYDALHTNHITAQTFWMQGGAAEVGVRMNRGLGIVVRVEGMHAGASGGSSTTTGEPLTLVTTVFGPRYTLESRSRRYALFGEALAGESNGFHSLFSEGSGPVGSPNAGTTSSANSPAIELGSGVDIRFSHHLGIRALQANYLRTQFPNTTTSIQNSFRISAGLFWRIGGRY